jgi:hypothetical protein
MRPSRGMGDMKKSKMLKGEAIGMATGGKLDISKAIKKPGALRSALVLRKARKSLPVSLPRQLRLPVN